MSTLRESLDTFVLERVSKAVDTLPPVPELTRAQAAVLCAVSRRMGLSMFEPLPRLLCHQQDYDMTKIEEEFAKEAPGKIGPSCAGDPS